MRLPANSTNFQQIPLPGLEAFCPAPASGLVHQPWITYGYDIDWSLLDSLDPDHPPVILSYGLGVDSTAMLLRFLFESQCRDFPLQNLVLLVAMTGDEWAKTADLVRRFVLPLCRRFGIWLIQVSRHGESEGSGITIHSSTRCPERLYIEGDYRLSQHLLINGVVPQKAKGKRFCTMKFKAFPIDQVVKLFFGDSPAVRYRRMIGYNADEQHRAEGDANYTTSGAGKKPRYFAQYDADEIARAQKDSSLTTAQHYRYLLGFNADETSRQKAEAATWRNQVFEFPLIQWGWSRQQCERYIAEITYLLELTEQLWVEAGRALTGHAIHVAQPEALRLELIEPTWWGKSCCQYCPFSCSNGGDDAARTARRTRMKTSKGRPLKLNQMIRRWQEQPTGGGLAAYLEHSAMAFSHYSGALYDSSAKKSRRPVRTVVDLLKAAGAEAALADYQARVDAAPQWAVYLVRRVFKEAIPPNKKAIARARARGKAAKPTFPTPPRQVKKLFIGDRDAAHDYLYRLARSYGKTPELIALSWRFWSIPRPRDESKRPFVEEMFVCVFVEARDKQDKRINFERLWRQVAGVPTSVRPISD